MHSTHKILIGLGSIRGNSNTLVINPVHALSRAHNWRQEAKAYFIRLDQDKHCQPAGPHLHIAIHLVAHVVPASNN